MFYSTPYHIIQTYIHIYVYIYIYVCVFVYVYSCILHKNVKGSYFYESLICSFNFPTDEYKRRWNALLQLCNSWKENWKKKHTSSVGRAFDCKYARAHIHTYVHTYMHTYIRTYIQTHCSNCVIRERIIE